MSKCTICGKEMLRASGCSIRHVFCNGRKYPRMKYGEEGWGSPGERCPDCGAKMYQKLTRGNKKYCPACEEKKKEK